MVGITSSVKLGLLKTEIVVCTSHSGICLFARNQLLRYDWYKIGGERGQRARGWVNAKIL